MGGILNGTSLMMEKLQSAAWMMTRRWRCSASAGSTCWRWDMLLLLVVNSHCSGSRFHIVLRVTVVGNRNNMVSQTIHFVILQGNRNFACKIKANHQNGRLGVIARDQTTSTFRRCVFRHLHPPSSVLMLSRQYFTFYLLLYFNRRADFSPCLWECRGQPGVCDFVCVLWSRS